MPGIDVLTPVCGQESVTMTDCVEKVLEQDFASHHAAQQGARERRTAAADHITEVTQLRDLQSAFLTGAKAAQDLNTSPVAREVLQIRGTQYQPQVEAPKV